MRIRCLVSYQTVERECPAPGWRPVQGGVSTSPTKRNRQMSYSRNVIERVSVAINYRTDERVLAYGGTFEEFQKVCIRSWEDAPLGDDVAPESCRTVAVARAA